ncbi:hypothetical protein, partial [Microbacterium sp. P5_E9]
MKDREKALGPFARAVEALLAPRKAADRTRDEVASGAVLKMPSTLSVLASATPQFLSSADALAGAMATALRARGSGSTGDIDRLKPHIVKLPFNPGGGRFRFLVALSADETLALPADWLEGLGPDELIALSDADSARLTRVPSWRSRVGEIAKQAILAATTRGRLLSLLASGAIATSVAPETASKAFQRVGGTDSAVRQWLQFLGRQDLIDDLTSAVSRLEARTADAENRASRQTAIASDANSRIAELQRRLDSAADSHDSVHDATLLQAERDAYRLVARILATAESEARNLNADQLATRLRQVVRVQGIEAIGTRDEVAVFDPAVHDAPSGRP